MSNPSSGGLAAQLLNQLQGQPLEQMAQQLDVSPAQAGSAVSAALPMMLGALAGNAQTAGGAQALLGALQRDHAGGGADLGGLLGQGGQSQPQSGGLAGGLLSSALDQNGDGKLDAGDLLKLGSRLLGGKS